VKEDPYTEPLFERRYITKGSAYAGDWLPWGRALRCRVYLGSKEVAEVRWLADGRFSVDLSRPSNEVAAVIAELILEVVPSSTRPGKRPPIASLIDAPASEAMALAHELRAIAN